MRWCALLLALPMVAFGTPAESQELSDEAADRCVRAAAKIIMLTDSGRGGSTGSGSIVDPRGYVLTNFHVVGHVHPRTGRPGTLINSRNRVLLATVESARNAARPRWVGAVVRGDVRLDLALIRILADTDGNRIEGAPFPTVQMATTDSLRPGSRVWAFGFPLGVRTINVTGGAIAGFQMNARDRVSWLRSDAEFNPGNSGGMLVDAQGRLVAVPTRVFGGGEGSRALEPVELARPVERIPRAWLEELMRGPIDDLRIEGVATLSPGERLQDTALGDGGSIGSPDQHLYVLSESRAGIARTDPPLPLGLLDGERLVREGRGHVPILDGDPDDLVLSVLVPGASETPVSFTVAYEPASPPPVAAIPPGSNSPAARAVMPGPVPSAPSRLPTTRNVAPSPAPNAPPTFPAARPLAATVRGQVVDALSGRPVPNAWILVGRPGTDLNGALRELMAGRLSENELQMLLVGMARSDVRGLYAIGGLAQGRYPVAAFARGYRPAPLVLTVSQQGGIIPLQAIQMQR